MPREFLNGRVILHPGDCMKILPTLEADSVDSVVTDPPYHLTSIVKRFGKEGSAPAQYGTNGAFARASRGFMGKQWDGGDIAFRPELWAEVLRVLKPGGYLLAFSSSRTFGRMSVAIEDAGFITHPFIAWIFGSGFPKAHNAAKAIDRELGATGSVASTGAPVRLIRPGADQCRDGTWEKSEDREYQPGQYQPANKEAAQWLGFAYGGQALKPALEPIYMGQKAFSEKNGARNILVHGTGALNVDGCRIPGEVNQNAPYFYQGDNGQSMGSDQGHMRKSGAGANNNLGRWPANVIHDGSDEVEEAFAAFGKKTSGRLQTHHRRAGKSQIGTFDIRDRTGEECNFGGDAGSASRFFYTAKADTRDRLGSRHPTVKPLDLIQYLVRLITPPGGAVLDLFAGTGTTGEAAFREGMRAILIEREAEYQADIERRMGFVYANDKDRKATADRMRDRPRADRYSDTGSLF